MRHTNAFSLSKRLHFGVLYPVFQCFCLHSSNKKYEEIEEQYITRKLSGNKAIAEPEQEVEGRRGLVRR